MICITVTSPKIFSGGGEPAQQFGPTVPVVLAPSVPIYACLWADEVGYAGHQPEDNKGIEGARNQLYTWGMEWT